MLAVCCEKVGEMSLRIYLTGRVLVEESGTVVLDERYLLGRQGHIAFAYRSGQPGRGATCLRTLQKSLLSEELGVHPSPQTEVVYLEIFRS